MPALNSLESRIVHLATERYRRPFYRWGHFSGWIAGPVAGLSLLPSLKPYELWLFSSSLLLMFNWYFVITTRLIGKLADQTNLAMPEVGPAGPEKLSFNRFFGFKMTLLIYLVMLPVAAAFHSAPELAHRWSIVPDAVAGVVIAAGAIGTVGMCGSYVVWFAGNKPLADRFMKFGIGFVFWAITMLPLAALLLPTDKR